MSSLHHARTVLSRPGPAGSSGPAVVWVGLNPSTADADVDDPTVRRIRGFSARAGFGDVTLVNLYQLRATAPRDLLTALRQHPLRGHPTPSAQLATHFHNAPVILAWGRPHNLTVARRAQRVTRLAQAHASELYTIGPPLAGGHPRHPLYAPYRLGLQTLTQA